MQRTMMVTLALASALAQAQSLPELPKLIFENGVAVWCGAPVNPARFDAPAADGSFTGRVYQRAQCATGGRGTKPMYWSACADVRWDASGSIALRWSGTDWAQDVTPVFVSDPGKAGVLPLPVSACL